MGSRFLDLYTVLVLRSLSDAVGNIFCNKGNEAIHHKNFYVGSRKVNVEIVDHIKGVFVFHYDLRVGTEYQELRSGLEGYQVKTSEIDSHQKVTALYLSKYHKEAGSRNVTVIAAAGLMKCSELGPCCWHRVV